MGLSNTPGLVWVLVRAVTLQSNTSGRAVGRKGQIYIKGQNSQLATPKGVFPEGMGNPREFRQAPVPVSAAFLPKFTLLFRKKHFPLQAIFGDLHGEILWCLPWSPASHQQGRSQTLRLKLDKGLGILRSGFGKRRNNLTANNGHFLPAGAA